MTQSDPLDTPIGRAYSEAGKAISAAMAGLGVSIRAAVEHAQERQRVAAIEARWLQTVRSMCAPMEFAAAEEEVLRLADSIPDEHMQTMVLRATGDESMLCLACRVVYERLSLGWRPGEQ